MYKKLSYTSNQELFVKELKFFLSKNKKSLLTFRYFNKRDLNVLGNHIYNSLYFNDGFCVGYGHLDLDDGKVWLGVITSEEFRGLGVGQFIVKDLISNYDGEVYLTVDLDNHVAINIYKKHGFTIIEENNKHFLMKKCHIV
jgi:ribosomal protein S18 acetylase RimI-like enzyme